MTKSYILTTSGFVLPLTAHHAPLDQSAVNDTSIFNKTTSVTFDTNLSELAKDATVHHSPDANKAFQAYEANKSFENFTAMLDIACEVLSKLDFVGFARLQAANRYLSTTGFQLCVDLMTRKFTENHKGYLIVPLNARFRDPASVTPAMIDQRSLSVQKYLSSRGLVTWENILTEIACDQQAFASFFRYVFVDAY